MNRTFALVAFAIVLLLNGFLSDTTSHAADAHKLVIIAGKPSHPPRMHEFNAGVQLLAKCLESVDGLEVVPVLNGWPQDESVFDDADSVVFYMDGGRRHEIVQEEGRRLKLIDEWAERGVGLGFMHFGVEVVADQAGAEMLRWIGGHYENAFSCNPIWEPTFAVLPDHPVTNGVKPFQILDEWYFNIRFLGGIVGNDAQSIKDTKFQPILLATPSDDVRDGTYVYPKGPYSHIQASAGRAEAVMWTVERADGGRGFGFTGGHFHDNWANDDYRKVVLNALVWSAQVEVPENGIASTVSDSMLEANLDKKAPQKKKPKVKKQAKSE
ncbi:ThuA domain-containing protein [Neorhodopirellula lusitana]|uniref:ThuA domain-containing protein n=1 Tax=Neorhodopirellula lusitana TaxID=445327 RepID=UPI0024B6B0AE|nr:ThuA domain-containing protein [Neorhodopirellula lusitana]